MFDNILLNSNNGAVNRDIPDEFDPSLVPAQSTARCGCLSLHPQE